MWILSFLIRKPIGQLPVIFKYNKCSYAEQKILLYICSQ